MDLTDVMVLKEEDADVGKPFPKIPHESGTIPCRVAECTPARGEGFGLRSIKPHGPDPSAPQKASDRMGATKAAALTRLGKCDKWPVYELPADADLVRCLAGLSRLRLAGAQPFAPPAEKDETR